jgi:hypothetical protein
LVSQREEVQTQQYGSEMMELTLHVTWTLMAVTWWPRYMVGTLVLIMLVSGSVVILLIYVVLILILTD